jgi:hypothetical protein
VELVLADGRTVRAQELDLNELVPLSASPDLDANSLRGSDLLQAQGLSLLELAGAGGNEGDSGGESAAKEGGGRPIVVAPIDPRVLLAINLILLTSFTSGGVSMFLTGRLNLLKGAFHWKLVR